MPETPKELKGKIEPQRREKGKIKRFTESERAKMKKIFIDEYSKDGMSMNKACKTVEVSRQVIYKWASTDPDFAKLFEPLHETKKLESKEKFEKRHKNDEEYKKRFLELYEDDIYSVDSALKEIDPKIDSQLFSYWLKTDFEFKKQYKALQAKTRPSMARQLKIKSAVSSVEVREKQRKFLKLFREYNFNATETCKQMGIKRTTAEEWCRNDPDFKNEVDNIQREKKDFAQNALLELAKKGDTAAVIFLNKIINKYADDHFIGFDFQEQPQAQRIDITHKYDKETIDAVVKAAELSSGKYFELPTKQSKQLCAPTIDAEYEEVEDKKAKRQRLLKELHELDQND